MKQKKHAVIIQIKKNIKSNTYQDSNQIIIIKNHILHLHTYYIHTYYQVIYTIISKSCDHILDISIMNLRHSLNEQKKMKEAEFDGIFL